MSMRSGAFIGGPSGRVSGLLRGEISGRTARRTTVVPTSRSPRRSRCARTSTISPIQMIADSRPTYGNPIRSGAEASVTFRTIRRTADAATPLRSATRAPTSHFPGLAPVTSFKSRHRPAMMRVAVASVPDGGTNTPTAIVTTSSGATSMNPATIRWLVLAARGDMPDNPPRCTLTGFEAPGEARADGIGPRLRRSDTSASRAAGGPAAGSTEA